MKHCRTTQINKLLLHFSEAEFNNQKKGMTESPYLHCRTVFRWGRRCASQEESGQHDCDALGVVLARPLTMLVWQWRQQACVIWRLWRVAMAPAGVRDVAAVAGGSGGSGEWCPTATVLSDVTAANGRRRRWGAVRSGTGEWWEASLEGGGA